MEIKELADNPIVVPIYVDGTAMVLMIDPRLELVRAKKALPLLTEYGRTKLAQRFPYLEYPYATDGFRCYDAAMRMAKRWGLVYVEGLVLFRTRNPEYHNPFPVAHVWCETRRGEIIDPTLHKNQHSPSILYMGIPLRREYTDAWYEKVGYYGCLDGDKAGKVGGVYEDSPNEWLYNGGHPKQWTTLGLSYLPRG